MINWASIFVANMPLAPTSPIFAASRKLVIELDGGQHLDQQEYDLQRSEYLRSKGYHVLRFWNNDVLDDLEGVTRVILGILASQDEGMSPRNSN